MPAPDLLFIGVFFEAIALLFVDLLAALPLVQPAPLELEDCMSGALVCTGSGAADS